MPISISALAVTSKHEVLAGAAIKRFLELLDDAPTLPMRQRLRDADVPESPASLEMHERIRCSLTYSMKSCEINTGDNHTRMIVNAEMDGNPNRHFHTDLPSGTVTTSLSWGP
jgi:hypothetical protein